MALLLAFACLGTLLPLHAGAQPAPYDTRARYAEDEVKAAFLFHFATYVEWPGDEEEVISFAVLQAPDVADELERFVGERRVQGRPVVVRRLRSIRELEGDEVLFIGSSQNRRLRRLTHAVKGPTLIVTDAPHGLPDGGMINFQLVNQRVRFEIALHTARQAGLALSSRLLSAALRVEMSRCHLECRHPEDVELRYAQATPLPAAIRTASRAS